MNGDWEREFGNQDNKKPKGRSDCPSVDEYLAMSEDEKDHAIQNAIIRLQTRVQEILYLMESHMKTTIISSGKEVNQGDPKKN
jgi:hypothetical protein